MKDQKCFSNTSARKYPSKMVQYSKRTYKYNRRQPCEIHILREIRNNHAWLNHLKPILNNFTMVLAEFLQKPCMIRVCCYLKGDLHRNILNTKPFSRYIFGLRYWNDNFDSSSIRSLFSCVFKFKGQKNLNNENFANTSETLVTLISKWPGISKIYPPILDHRMF